ncbi:zinc-binding alcohol dehydrogenase family protein, partial [Streptomyces brasiliscabiei]
PPRFADVAAPTPAVDQELVTVLASAIHPRVRSQADGSHYSTTGDLPLIPGVDGVARDARGDLRYFVVESGAMAEQALVDPRRSVLLPADIDPI